MAGNDPQTPLPRETGYPCARLRRSANLSRSGFPTGRRKHARTIRVAPQNAFEKRDTAIDIDEAEINDDRDMLQEMRIVLRAHRVPGMGDEDVPSPGQVLRMATVGGATTTPYGSHIGTLAVGAAPPHSRTHSAARPTPRPGRQIRPQADAHTHQKEARASAIAAGETQRSVARSYNVSHVQFHG